MGTDGGAATRKGLLKSFDLDGENETLDGNLVELVVGDKKGIFLDWDLVIVAEVEESKTTDIFLTLLLLILMLFYCFDEIYLKLLKSARRRMKKKSLRASMQF